MPEHDEDCPARHGLGRCDCDDPVSIVATEQDDDETEEDFDDDYYGHADPADTSW